MKHAKFLFDKDELILSWHTTSSVAAQATGGHPCHMPCDASGGKLPSRTVSSNRRGSWVSSSSWWTDPKRYRCARLWALIKCEFDLCHITVPH